MNYSKGLNAYFSQLNNTENTPYSNECAKNTKCGKIGKLKQILRVLVL